MQTSCSKTCLPLVVVIVLVKIADLTLTDRSYVRSEIKRVHGIGAFWGGDMYTKDRHLVSKPAQKRTNILQHCRRICHKIELKPSERGFVKKKWIPDNKYKSDRRFALFLTLSLGYSFALSFVCFNCYPLGCLSMPHAGGRATCATPWMSWYAYTYLKIKIKMVLVENGARQYGQRGIMVTHSFGCLVAATPPW